MEHQSTSEFLPSFPHFATIAIHFAQEPEQWNSRAVVPPITLSTSFKQEEFGKNEQEECWKKPNLHQSCGLPEESLGFQELMGRSCPVPCSNFSNKKYVYTRFGNPNRHILQEVVGTLDGVQCRGQSDDWASLAAADGAKYCLAYSSGMGAILNICHLLKSGDKIVCTVYVYAGTKQLFDRLHDHYNVGLEYVDCTNPENLEAAITPETKLVWLETPTNPTLKVIDIRACADVVHRHPGVLVAVDNSFMSPYFQRPLSLGADICMTSATKYINGHSDVLMGLVSVNNEELYKELKFLQSHLGAVPSPFDCYMCNRGLKTLHIRMKLHFHNGLAVAKFLKSHPRVEKVIYPGLHSHPQYEVTKKQNTGVSGMMSFYIKGNIDNAFAFLKSLKVFSVGLSLGGYESLAEHPATMSHASVPEGERKALGITDTLIRLSVGLEDDEDLRVDLDQALEAAFA
ncbi:cystathionine gamma-lyase-like [Hirundo rustica]|uniref:cystathionine gamma-lyase-like n=1 Tax=Hirundo rustica TaxID=43150 RepID=UPI001A95378B|nr:cystathionine gamma-lyase-like [Hirundo rustica]